MASSFSTGFTSDHLCIESTLYTLNTRVVWSENRIWWHHFEQPLSTGAYFSPVVTAVRLLQPEHPTWQRGHCALVLGLALFVIAFNSSWRPSPNSANGPITSLVRRRSTCTGPCSPAAVPQHVQSVSLAFRRYSPWRPFPILLTLSDIFFCWIWLDLVFLCQFMNI